MSTADERSSSLERLGQGQHVHLDKLVENAPPPGSSLWLPILRRLARDLAQRGGSWTVTMPLGTCFEVPIPIPDAAGVVTQVDAATVAEPPAVYRLADTLTANRWEGEYHSRKSVVSPEIMEIVSFERGIEAPPDETGFLARIALEVREGGSGT